MFSIHLEVKIRSGVEGAGFRIERSGFRRRASMTTLTSFGSNCGSAKTQVAPNSLIFARISESRSAPGALPG